MKIFIILASVLALAGFFVILDTAYADDVPIGYLTIRPNPPQPGKTCTVTYEGLLGESGLVRFRHRRHGDEYYFWTPWQESLSYTFTVPANYAGERMDVEVEPEHISGETLEETWIVGF